MQMCLGGAQKNNRKEDVCMLNVHSFLRRIKENTKGTGIECYKSCLMVCAYAIAGVVLVLCADSSIVSKRDCKEAYVKAATITRSRTDRAKEEIGNEAQIQAENENVNLLAHHVQEGEVAKETDNYSLQIVNRTIIAADKQNELIGQSINQTGIGNIGIRNVVYDQKSKIEEPVEKVESKSVKKLDRQKQSKGSNEKKITKVAANKQIKEKKTQEYKKTVPTISLEANQKKVLLRIVEAEATGEDIKGKMLVANVILNRVKSSHFPNSVEGVVFQKNGSTTQFSPVADGRYWSVNISKETQDAVDRVLKGEDYSQGALYFSARSKAKKSSMNWFDNHLTWLFKYGGHEFYK